MKTKFLSANAVKFIAIALMLLDHICVMFPIKYGFYLRCVCRVSFPLFAYFIAEGCKYTRNKLKRFLMPFVLGVIFQVVYCGAVFSFKDLGTINILLTFSVSILIIYILQECKNSLSKRAKLSYFWIALLFIAILSAFFMCQNFTFDYGFAGILAPVIMSLPDLSKTEFSPQIKNLVDTPTQKLFCSLWAILSLPFSVPFFGLRQLYGIFALPILYCYNQKRGKYNVKYLFYVFYPLHFVVLYVIKALIN